MKFRFIKKVEGEVVSYGNTVTTGSVVDLNSYFSKKAINRPKDYQVCEVEASKPDEVNKPDIEIPVKKRLGRPKKSQADSEQP